MEPSGTGWNSPENVICATSILQKELFGANIYEYIENYMEKEGFADGTSKHIKVVIESVSIFD